MGPPDIESRSHTEDSRALRIFCADEQTLRDEWLPTPDTTTRALQRLYESLDRTDHLDTALTRLCAHALELVAESDMAGIALVDTDGNPYTAACTAPAVERIDALQYLSGSGPCLDAAEGGEIVVADYADAVCRWPGFSAEARRYAVSSFLSVPLPYLPPGVRSGALNLYSARCEGFRQSQAAVLILFVTAAGYVVMREGRYRFVRHRTHSESNRLSTLASEPAPAQVLQAQREVL